MVLEFEGAIDNISEAQLAFIRNVLEKKGCKNTKVHIEGVGQAGDNYIANVKRIISKNEHGEFRMIAKIAPQMESLRMATQLEILFRNEHVLYTLVLPKYQQLEEEAGLPKSHRLRFAECYGSLSEAPNEVILLEDLQVTGFSMLDRFTPLSDECIRSVLRNFALLHSLSFVFKYKELETFKEYTNDLCDSWSHMGQRKDALLYFANVENTVISTVEGDDRKRYLEGCVSEAILLSIEMSKQVANSEQSVIQQGDSWTNNILFKFDGDSLEQSVLIDYQMSRVNNPTYDLFYMIFSCSDHETRLEHYNDWIDYYHSELDKSLRSHGLKANYVYPRDQLDADMKKYAKVMLGKTVLLSTILIQDSKNAEKMKDSMEQFGKDDAANETLIKEMISLDNKFIQMFKKRVEGIVDSFVRFELL